MMLIYYGNLIQLIATVIFILGYLNNSSACCAISSVLFVTGGTLLWIGLEGINDSFEKKRLKTEQLLADTKKDGKDV